MANVKLGAQLYTIREFTKTPEDIERSLRKIKGMGFDVIQISGFGPIDPQRLADLVHELELDVCVTHTPYDRLTGDLDAVIAEHKLLGCDTIGLGAMPAKFREGGVTMEGYREFIKVADEIGTKIHDAGLHFAYHNHNFEFQKLEGKTVMDRLVEDTAPEKFGFILDTFWLQMGGVIPASYIRKVAGRMKVCHFKDYAVNDRTAVFAEVGEGNLDLHEAFRACEESGVSYIVIEEDVCPRDPFDCLANSFKNLKDIAANH
ncbi:MAG: sugar phosphate isomerase/epimerase [Provencibacterium sp.]|jgi:sugar phosphate isomerase/epimerase|nr:sugar phosphate isomerase/epimerase [Provencibacterium sp.]